MNDEKREFHPLTREELDSLAGEPLPERAAMSLLGSGIAAPSGALVLPDSGVQMPVSRPGFTLPVEPQD
jgi:hypothetical protein